MLRTLYIMLAEKNQAVLDFKRKVGIAAWSIFGMLLLFRSVTWLVLQLAAGFWLPAGGYWLLVTGYWSPLLPATRAAERVPASMIGSSAAASSLPEILRTGDSESSLRQFARTNPDDAQKPPVGAARLEPRHLPRKGVR